jgi:integrase
MGTKNLAPKNMWEKTMTTIEEAKQSTLQQPLKPTPSNMKAKIVEYSFWMLKEGYAESTILSRTKLMKIMVKRGANLFDPESVKEIIAKQKCWSAGRKANAVNAYTSYLIMTGGKWDPPKYNRVKKLPFIPTEAEVDQLIAGCGPKTATLLQLLKETGMRIGEAWRLKWNEIDMVNNTVRVTPEKGSNPRIFKLSGNLMAMLDSMKRRAKNSRVFCKSLKSKRRCFEKQRKTVARKLKNPRIREITFHTLRHFKATMEYHKTKDILHVMKVLGHKNIKNTLIYTQLVDLQNDDYIVRVAHNIEEDKELVEAGFEYITERDGLKIYRKRK